MGSFGPRTRHFEARCPASPPAAVAAGLAAAGFARTDERLAVIQNVR
jgi:hypothetical protein